LRGEESDLDFHRIRTGVKNGDFDYRCRIANFSKMHFKALLNVSPPDASFMAVKHVLFSCFVDFLIENLFYSPCSSNLSSQDKSEDLADAATNFNTRATRLRKQMWWKDFRTKLFIGIAIAIVLLIIILSVTLKHNG